MAGTGTILFLPHNPESDSVSSPPLALRYELKVTLLGIEPPIWRRLLVPATLPLGYLHDALQIVLGWTDSHLHQFEREGRIWSQPDWYEDDDIEVGDESLIAVSRVLTGEGDILTYRYDFGDDWTHEIAVERIGAEGLDRPICVAGERRCPPEDVGGVHGYTEFLEVIFDPTHEEFEHYRQWAGLDFSPEAFDIEKVNAALARKRWPKRRAAASRRVP
ncbi:MAG: plasmid pRiA4b ORF-3 family protein [Acidobacteriota bacterium]|nr:plasmid pRiA4b ORF-3 family protein [Acidobacteriota bacterium]